MKRIFVLSNSLLSGGAEKQSIYLTAVLSQSYNVTLVVFTPKEANDPKLLKLAENYSINTIFLEGRKLKQFSNFYSLLRKNRPEIIFSFLFYTNILNGIAGSLAGVQNRIGGIRNSYIPPVKLFIQRLVHNYLLSLTVTNNYSSLSQLKKAGFENNKIKVIPNCIRIDNTIVSRDNSSSVNLITTGRFVKQKNYEGLVRIFQRVQLKSRAKQVKLYIIGFGELENEVRNLITDSKLTNVEIVINPVDLPSYYKKADIYLSTSFFEGMSNSIMEAMAHCLPVVATNVGDNDKLVLNNKTGFLVDLHNENEFADKVLDLIDNYNKRITMGIRGNEYIRKNYSEEKYNENVRSIIEC